jgi:hypothetical protein
VSQMTDRAGPGGRGSTRVTLPHYILARNRGDAVWLPDRQTKETHDSAIERGTARAWGAFPSGMCECITAQASGPLSHGTGDRVGSKSAMDYATGAPRPPEVMPVRKS